MTDSNRGKPFWRGRMVFAVALLTGMLLVGVAGAATGVLPVGSDIENGNDPEHEHEHGADDQHVVARGTSAVAGPWRLTALKHPADENSPEGDCLQLLVTDPPEGAPISATILCQDVGESAFKADSVPVIDTKSGNAETLIFGSSPAASALVELTADAEMLRADTAETPAGFTGRPWVIAVPSGHKSGRLTSVDGDGVEQATLDASRYFDQLALWERNLD